MSADGRRYKRVYADEWHHPEFRRLNATARVVRLYLSAGPQATSCGCYRLSTAVAVEDLGGTAEDFEECLGRVCEAYGWAWDQLARVVWIADWFTNNPPANANVVKAWVKLLNNVPDCDVKAQAIESLTNSIKTLSADYREAWSPLMKSFRETQSRTQSRTESIQEAGNRKQFSESKRAGARRADGSERKRLKTKNEPTDQRLVLVAHETLRLIGESMSIDDQIESFYHVARQQNLEPRRADVVAALAEAQSERRPA